MKVEDLTHDVPCKTSNSFVALAGSWLSPADPVNTSHKGGMHHAHENPLELGVDETPENSVLGLLSTWIGGVAQPKPANISHEHHHHSRRSEALGPDHLNISDLTHNVKQDSENSLVALAESWLSPAGDAAAATELPPCKNPLDVGVDSTASNSFMGLVSTWVGPTEEGAGLVNGCHESHHHHPHGAALGPEHLTMADIKSAYK